MLSRPLATLPFRVVSLHGAPRSGTSWLGKVFDSHPDVAYRFQPLFSYRFKGAIDADSSPQEVQDFLQQLYAVRDDEFILQHRQIARGAHPPAFEKNHPLGVLVMKEVRYHHVIPAMLRAVPDSKVVGIVRHPCGAINSWLKTPREFRPEWDAMQEWRSAPSKNRGRSEEYYGFERWKELARLFLKLEREFPQRFFLMRYEALASQPQQEIGRLFQFCSMTFTDQVVAFLIASQAREVEDPDTVFRTPVTAERWRVELNPIIQENIFRDLQGGDLDLFLR